MNRRRMTEEATPPASSEESAPDPAPQAPVDEPERLPEGQHEEPLATEPQAVPAAVAAPVYRPNYVFLAVVAIVTLVADLGSKWWAKTRLEDLRSRGIDVVDNHLAFVFARNRGGAWGLLQDEPETIRRPFFLGISVVAIIFIVSLYRRLTPPQLALKWGLPLVLGGALGNLVNRIQFNYVVDFIDYRAAWVRSMNGLFSQNPSDHWPTFNVADIAICVGVGLMAVDMFTTRRPPAPEKVAGDAAAPPSAPVSGEASAPVEPAEPAAPPPPPVAAPIEAAPKET
jgi:signal peptidase II